MGEAVGFRSAEHSDLAEDVGICLGEFEAGNIKPCDLLDVLVERAATADEDETICAADFYRLARCLQQRLSPLKIDYVNVGYLLSDDCSPDNRKVPHG